MGADGFDKYVPLGGRKRKASTSSNFINGQSQIKKKKQNRYEKGMS